MNSHDVVSVSCYIFFVFSLFFNIYELFKQNCVLGLKGNKYILTIQAITSVAKISGNPSPYMQKKIIYIKTFK